MAYEEPTDEFFYGGAGGGGKTDLLLGLAVTKHRKSVIFRREYKQLRALIDRSHEIITRGGTEPGNGKWVGGERMRWTFPNGRFLEFGGLQFAGEPTRRGDEEKWRGQPHDFYGFDEVTDFTQYQIDFTTTWARTDVPSQKVAVALAGNPPTQPQGRWIVKRYAPWLDKQHPMFPYRPGSPLYYARLDKDEEMVLLEDGDPFTHRGVLIVPRSRTFIPARVEDNPVYMQSGYKQHLLSLPEPLRSQMLYGDFSLAMDDDERQIIPSQWIYKAIERWDEHSFTKHLERGSNSPDFPLSQLGVDVARGGADVTVLVRRYANWIAPLDKLKGVATEDGIVLAQHALSILYGYPEDTPCVVDVVGVGTSPFDQLSMSWDAVYGVNASVSVKEAMERTGTFRFANMRAYMWWMLREMLDPANQEIDNADRLCLPDDPDLIADLAAPRFEIRMGRIYVESKDDVRKRIGRSTDLADALALAVLPVDNFSHGSMRVLQL